MIAFEEDLSRVIRPWKYGTNFDKLHWHLLPSPLCSCRRKMKISVKTLDSQTKNFTVSDAIKVKEFKEYIASEVNIPADKQRLIFRGKVLQDDKLLSEYGANGCVIHLVERKPQTGGGSSQDGPGSSSSSSTGHSHDGSLGPNIVMGAFSMPVDDDGSSVNVHINLQATTQPGNDVSQRINRARHFLRAASSALNRTELWPKCFCDVV
ncbi:Large proline-rich protein BAG6 [Acropora cervicornis]|uniref:Large proline-rich protein BAG6 n=1 Tax=Acropora cervicornis TaxID=6130 RepID=A0AAD9QR42_ACRCE|nr:Large proline-rich protein BAG6 [Acropora cervicornis]